MPSAALEAARIVGLSAVDLLSVVLIADRAHDGPVPVTDRDLARDALVTDRTMRAIVARLESSGMVEVHSLERIDATTARTAYTAHGFISLTDAVAKRRNVKRTAERLAQRGEAARAARIGHAVACT